MDKNRAENAVDDKICHLRNHYSRELIWEKKFGYFNVIALRYNFQKNEHQLK